MRSTVLSVWAIEEILSVKTAKGKPGGVNQVSFDFGRILTAMVTPFSEKGDLDLEQARKLARYLVDNGSDALVVAGTTGESPTLSREEKIQLYQTVVEEVGGRSIVVAGTGSNNTQESVALSQAAEQAGVDALMLVCPYYNKPSQEGLYRHFRVVAESTRLPILLYNIPSRSGVNLLPATVLRLSEVPNILAIKEASGNLDQVTQLVSALPAGFRVYSGDDALTLPILAIGGHGVVSVVSHLAGLRLAEMVKAFHVGNVATAARLHQELYPLIKAMFITTNPVPVKAALNLLGLQVGPPRLPLVEATDAEKNALRQILQQTGLL